MQATESIFFEGEKNKISIRGLVAGLADTNFGVVWHRRQTTVDGRTDWRKAYGQLEMEPCQIPVDVANKCCRIMDDLRLAFGAFDLIVTPDGRHVFLEVNQMGQFLFVERHTGMPLLDAFCELLLQGRQDFHWNESKASVRYLDIARDVEVDIERTRQEHVSLPVETWNESSTPRLERSGK